MKRILKIPQFIKRSKIIRIRYSINEHEKSKLNIEYIQKLQKENSKKTEEIFHLKNDIHSLKKTNDKLYILTIVMISVLIITA